MPYLGEKGYHLSVKYRLRPQKISPKRRGEARPAGEISRTPYAKAEKYATILLTNFVYAGGYWVWQSLFISGSY